ncbi:unnamed protein product [Rangifer tarandus platyrhynchus]|uniref:Basic proline-rich protein-like n=2 Tax=Rangifer tarandus platyrhynchus TaxID=3082113 RepID=A0ABN8YFU3_RANTA|nr:unnamed protein product [Rangifer tarandus platyrhynchus]CAI9700307.1 unnamed protein product [Rangifer tarandus platyrhynchus]
MPTRGLQGPLPGRLAARPERNHWLPSEPLAQHPVFPAHPESTGHQGNCLGKLPRARGARLSPPEQTLRTRLGSERGAWPQHPTDEPGAAPGPRRPPELLSPPSWAGPVVSERAWVPGVAIPYPKPPDRAPRPPAPPPTRPRDAQEPSERPREATDPGEAPRGAARRPGARLAHRPSQPARACGPGRTGAHSDPAGLPAPDVQRAPPTRAGRRALPAALQRTFSPPGSEEAARPASSAGRVPSRPGGDARAQCRRRGRARTRVNQAGAAGTRGGADTRAAAPPPPRVTPARCSAAAARRPARGRPEPGPPLDHRRTPARPAAGKVEPLLTGCPGARPPPAIAARRPRRRPPLPRRGAAEAAQAAQAEAAAPGLRCVAAAAAQHEWGARRADADRPRSRRPRSAARMRRPGGPGRGGACSGAGPARGGAGGGLQGALDPRRLPGPHHTL